MGILIAGLVVALFWWVILPVAAVVALVTLARRLFQREERNVRGDVRHSDAIEVDYHVEGEEDGRSDRNNLLP